MHVITLIVIVAVCAALSACTVQPLGRAGAPAIGGETASVTAALASTDVDPVATRTEQQVRNQLLFAMNGGELRPGGTYRVTLSIEEQAQNVAVEAESRIATSAQIILNATYTLVDVNTGKTIAQGKRVAIAAYDRTPQSFANQRALRDAQNRAARSLAQQIRLAIAQTYNRLQT